MDLASQASAGKDGPFIVTKMPIENNKQYHRTSNNEFAGHHDNLLGLNQPLNVKLNLQKSPILRNSNAELSMAINNETGQMDAPLACAMQISTAQFSMTNLSRHNEALTVCAVHDQDLDTILEPRATLPQTDIRVRRAQRNGMNDSSIMIDASPSHDQSHNDLLSSCEKYLQREATTEDWAQQHTKQQYYRQPMKPATKLTPEQSQINGPNPFEVGSKEWMEELDKRMGFSLPTLPDHPRDQEVRGETYKDWYARHGCKTEWDPSGFCMVEPRFGYESHVDDTFLENEAGWLLDQYVEEKTLGFGMVGPSAFGEASSEVARNEVENEGLAFQEGPNAAGQIPKQYWQGNSELSWSEVEETPFPHVDMAAIRKLLQQQDNHQSDD